MTEYENRYIECETWNECKSTRTEYKEGSIYFVALSGLHMDQSNLAEYNIIEELSLHFNSCIRQYN